MIPVVGNGPSQAIPQVGAAGRWRQRAVWGTRFVFVILSHGQDNVDRCVTKRSDGARRPRHPGVVTQPGMIGLFGRFRRAGWKTSGPGAVRSLPDRRRVRRTAQRRTDLDRWEQLQPLLCRVRSPASRSRRGPADRPARDVVQGLHQPTHGYSLHRSSVLTGGGGGNEQVGGSLRDGGTSGDR
jgi:hypothetical protein